MSDFDMPEDLNNSLYVDGPGIFHFTVDAIEENPTSNSGSVLDGKRLTLTVLAGTAPDQVGRKHSETIFNPNLSSKDQGRFAGKKIGRLVRALRMHDVNTGRPAAECRGQRISLNWNEAIGRQFVGTLVTQKDDPRYVEIKGADFYDVADDEVASVPKDMQAISLMQQQTAPQQPVQQPVQTAQQQVPQQSVQQQQVPQQPSQPPAQQQAPQQSVASGGAAASEWGDLL